MTIRESVQIADPTAKVFPWSDYGFWVKGNGWETKVAYSEARAWEIAAEIIATTTVQGVR